MSCLSKDTYDALLRDHTLLLQPSLIGPTITCANSQPIPVLGRVSLDFFINGHPFNHSFHVVPSLSYPLILGLEWLQKCKGVIDFAKNTLRIGQLLIDLDNSTHPPLKAKLHALGHTTIPPFSEKVIQTSIKSHIKPKDAAFIPNQSAIENKFGLHLTDSISKIDRKSVPVKI